jgi:MFS transporter, putative metabolite:H+ symporter
LFFVLVMIQRFFGDGSYAIIGPYIAEVWPARLRASGMGLGYGVGNLGKIIGPLGLALIIGSSNYVSPKATLDAIGPAFLFLAFWYALAATAFWLVGFETKGRSIDEIDASLAGADAVKARAV